MAVQYLTDAKGKKTGVLVAIKDWEKIQKELNTAHLYEDFRESLREIKEYNAGANVTTLKAMEQAKSGKTTKHKSAYLIFE